MTRDLNSKMNDYSTLLPPSWKTHVDLWLENDTPKLDWGGFIVGDGVMEAKILGKAPGVLAGVPFATAVFDKLGCSIQWFKQEGEEITADEAKAKTPIAVSHIFYEGP